VFLPFCNHNDKDTKQVDNNKKLFLVGMTRSRGDLIISFSKKLNRFVAKFAENCTQKNLEHGSRPSLFDNLDRPVQKSVEVKTSELFGW
jgi:hypothetical protein